MSTTKYTKDAAGRWIQTREIKEVHILKYTQEQMDAAVESERAKYRELVRATKKVYKDRHNNGIGEYSYACDLLRTALNNLKH